MTTSRYNPDSILTCENLSYLTSLLRDGKENLHTDQLSVLSVSGGDDDIRFIPFA